MRKSVVLITPPASEPVTLAEVKSWARIDSDDENTLITSLIVAARQEAEKYLKRALVSQTWELTLDAGKSSLDDMLGDGVYQLPITALYTGLPENITLPYAPIQSITSVKTFDLTNTESTFSASNYTLDGAGSRFIMNFGSIWPSNLRYEAAVKIRYVAGYGTGSDVPHAIKIAIMQYVADVYESRGICDTVIEPLAQMQSRLYSYRNMTSD